MLTTPREMFSPHLERQKWDFECKDEGAIKAITISFKPLSEQSMQSRSVAKQRLPPLHMAAFLKTSSSVGLRVCFTGDNDGTPEPMFSLNNEGAKEDVLEGCHRRTTLGALKNPFCK